MTDINTDTTAQEEIKPEKVVPSEDKEEAPKSYLSIVKANPSYSDASFLFHWRDPVKSGLLFGIFHLIFFLLTWAEYTVVTLVSYMLLSLLAVCFGYANYVVLKASWIQGKHTENPFKERFKNAKFHISKQTVEKHLNTFVDSANLTIDNARDIFYVTNNVLSLQFIFYFYVAATLGNWFSGTTIIYFVVLGLFVWPRLYEEKKKEIDQIYGIGKEQASKYLDMALSKLPPSVTSRLPFLKPHNQ